MKRLLATITGVLLSAGSAIAAQEGLAAVDQAWTKAMLAQDAAAVAALYAPDAVMYPPDAMEVKGRDAIRKEYEQLLSTYRVQDATLTPGGYETHGDTSAGWGRFRLTLVPKAGGEPVTMEGRYTAVGKKTGGKWHYIADHASAPLPPPPAAAPPAK
jgi:uncharacterized protein (TIGR02246 family)